MPTVASPVSLAAPPTSVDRRANALAERLEQGARALAAAVRALSDEELDRAAAVSLNADAPLTCQFFLEDHAVRHSYHHLARIRAALARTAA